MKVTSELVSTRLFWESRVIFVADFLFLIGIPDLVADLHYLFQLRVHFTFITFITSPPRSLSFAEIPILIKFAGLSLSSVRSCALPITRAIIHHVGMLKFPRSFRK